MANYSAASPRLILLIVVLACSSGFTHASSSLINENPKPSSAVVTVNSTGAAINLSPLLQILEDKTKKLDISQVSSARYAAKFTPSSHDLLTLQNPASVYWFKLDLVLDAAVGQPLQKIIYFPIRSWYISKLDYYEAIEGAGFRTVSAGRSTPYNVKDVATQSIAFKLNLLPKQISSVYFRIDQSENGVAMPLSVELLSENQFIHKDNHKNTLAMAFYGIILAFFVYNLLLYIALREALYGYYLLFLAVNIVALTIADGLPDRFIWPSNSSQIMTLYVIVVCLYYISYLKFISHTLSLPSSMPAAAKVFSAIYLMFAGIIAAHLLVGDAPIIAKLRLMCGVLALVTAATVTIKAALKKQRLAIYLLIAESVFIGTYLTGLLIGMAAIPLPGSYIPLTNYFGAAAEAILLSLVIAEKMRMATLEIFESEKRVLRAEAKQQSAESNKLHAENRAKQAETDKERELVQAQQEVIDAQKSSLKLKNDFISSISHELRTPMNGIMGGVQLAQLNSPQKNQRHLDLIEDSASEMMALVDDILIHTESQSDRIYISSDSTDIYLLLDELHQHYQKLCAEKNLQLNWVVNPNLAKWVTTDKEKLIIILSKLLDNAVKFTDLGFISFNICCQKSSLPWQLIATVSDSGAGIDKHNQAHIFSSFTQGESGFQRRFGGLGIGLAICKSLTLALGGTIQLDSSGTSGSVFSIRLPIKEVTQLPNQDCKQKPTMVTELPILIVEDNIVNQKIIQKLLEKLGFVSLIANHGMEALNILQQRPVALILMDLQMPVMDGFTCSGEIRKSHDSINNIPIIALTANVMDVDKKRCLENGMNGFLMKPVSLKLLEASLAKYVTINVTPPNIRRLDQN